jgi:hypothetical protein
MVLRPERLVLHRGNRPCTLLRWVSAAELSETHHCSRKVIADCYSIPDQYCQYYDEFDHLGDADPMVRN